MRRCYFACDIRYIEGTEKWELLESVIEIETIHSLGNHRHTKAEWKYYISSHPDINLRLPDMIRNHWGIENKLDCVLDVHWGEDNEPKGRT